MAVGEGGKREEPVPPGTIPGTEPGEPSLTARTIRAARWRSASISLQAIVASVT